MKTILSTILILMFALVGFGQTKLTNKDVVEMVAAGLPEAVVISKINTSQVVFNTEVPDLKLLQEAKVPEKVIAAMIEKAAEKPTPVQEVQFVFEGAEHGSFSEIARKTKVFLVVPDLKSREIIANALNKSQMVQVVNSREECDFAMAFGLQTVEAGSNALLGTTSNKILVGDLLAYTYLPVTPGSATGRIRIVWNKRKSQDWSGGMTFNRHPAQNAINDFLKDYKKLNK